MSYFLRCNATSVLLILLYLPIHVSSGTNCAVKTPFRRYFVPDFSIKHFKQGKVIYRRLFSRDEVPMSIVGCNLYSLT